MAVMLLCVLVVLVLMSVPIAFALIGTAAVVIGFGDGMPHRIHQGVQVSD